MAVKSIKLSPLTGAMDTRSEPEDLAGDRWRLVQNFAVTSDRKLCRARGWMRALDGYATTREYNNEDLHDQLLSLQTYYDKLTDDTDDSAVVTFPPYNASFATTCGTTLKTRSQGKQPITLTAQVETSIATRKLIAGTQSRLYALNQRKGNWKIIADGFGGTTSNPEIRFRHAQLGDYVLFTNNYDEIHYWPVDGPTTGCEMQSVFPIPELQEIGVTAAGVIVQWKGVVFIADTVEDGVRYTYRVRWCDRNDPFAWVEDSGVSLAGFFDLEFGEHILSAGAIGDFLYFHTNRGIWQVTVVADVATIFNFQKRYSSSVGNGCIKYPHTFVSDGDTHRYMAQDGIYEWTPYQQEPDRAEWLHLGSGFIYEGLNKSVCAIHTAGFDPDTQQLYFSAAQNDDTLPSVTLVANTRYKHTHKLDHGFTAFTPYIPDDRQSIYDWVKENGICDEEGLNASNVRELGWYDPKEGPGVASTVDIATPRDAIYTTTPKTVSGVTTEDYEAASASANSLCALIGDVGISDACLQCESEQVFLAASASDWCIKQFADVYYRQRYVAASDSYVLDGYTSRLLKIINGGGSGQIAISRVLLGYLAELQTIPSNMNLRVGASARGEDPLLTCGIEWNDEGGREISCNELDREMAWLVWAADVWLYVDLTIAGTGGGSCYAKMEIDLQRV